MLKGICGATLANYQLCVFKEHYQHKDPQLYTHLHTRAHNPFTPFITPVSDISFSSNQTVFFSLDCYCPLVLKLHSIFSSSSQSSFSFDSFLYFLRLPWPSFPSPILHLFSMFSLLTVPLSIPTRPIPTPSSLSAPWFPLLQSLSPHPYFLLLLLPAPLPPPGQKQKLK